MSEQLILLNGTVWIKEGPMRPCFSNLAAGQGCQECDNPRGGPLHFGSPICKSGGLGTHDGNRAHCSCDACY